MSPTVKCILYMYRNLYYLLWLLIHLKTTLLILFLTEGGKEFLEDLSGQKTTENKKNAETSK